MANGLFGGGNGTVNNPYLVEDIADLRAIINDMSACYKQTAHIDLSGIEWLPLGWDPDIEFTGTYDGDEYKIFNLTINTPDKSYLGLFSWNDSGAIFKNITLVNPQIVGDDEVGGIIGFCDGATFENCHVDGGKIEGEWFVGGLTGADWAYSDANAQPRMFKCSTSCDVIAHQGEAGGLASWCAENTLVEQCYTTGKITSSEYGGGLFSWAQEGTVVKNCYSTSDVIWGTHVSNGQYSHAGLVGFSETVEFINCYFAGKLIGDDFEDEYGYRKTYGLIGDIGNGDSVTVSNCYYDSELSGKSDSDKGTPKTTAEMKQQATFENWDFDTIWTIKENEDYPRFLWEPIKCIAIPLSTLKVNVIT